MSFVLRNAGEPEPLEPLTEHPPTWMESFSAARDAARIEMDSWNLSGRTEAQVMAEMNAALGPDPDPPARAPLGSNASASYQRARLFERMQAAVAQDPERYLGIPSTPDQLATEVTSRLSRQYEDAQDVLQVQEGGSWTANLLGQLWAGATDDMTVATLPFGAPARASVLAFTATEAVLGMAGEAISLPRQYAQAERLGIPDPDPLTQILAAGALSGALGGAIIGTQRALVYRHIRRSAEDETGAFSNVPSERDGDAGASTASTLTASPLTASTPETPGRARPGQPEQALPPGVTRQPEPDGWDQIRNGIFLGESGGDYDALFSFQNRPGGRFQDVRVTDMTVDQAIGFSAPQGEYGQWVKGRIGRVATPMGAYQVVGKTLRAAKRGLGLSGDEVMTPALQDQIGLWIYWNQGTRAWAGYRGPQRVPPNPGAASAPAVDPFTTRGYTSAGQVRVGERILDVQYEVVDASLLRQASGDLQPRDRTRAASDAWVAETAARLDPALLMPSPTGDRGAPLVGPDNVIESGNGRVRAIEAAQARFPDRADAYRAQIEAAGFTIPEDVERPVLIARRGSDLTPEARREMVIDAQDSGVARMTGPERAAVGQRALTADTLALYRPGRKLTAADNRDFARAFSGFYPASERGAFTADDGGLSADGVRQIRDSLFARAWPDSDVLTRRIEGADGDMRTLLDALEEAAPAWARLRAEIDAGMVAPELDISREILDAVRLIGMARAEADGVSQSVADLLDELLAETDLFGTRVHPLTQALARYFAPGGNQRPAKKLAAFLTRYADEARKVGQTGDSLLDRPGPLDVLRAIDKRAFGHLDEADMAVRPEPNPAPVEIEDLPEDAFAEGAQGADAIEVDEALSARIREEAGAVSDEFADIEMEMEDGTMLTASDILDDLDADETLDTIVELCASGRTA